MGMVHPATAQVVDPDIPVVAVLLSEPLPGPIAAVVDEAGGVVVDGELLQVTWWPGQSITARYRVDVEGGAWAGTQDVVAVGGLITPGAARVTSSDGEVGVWRVPHDPALPGMEPALDDARAGRLLADLGASSAEVKTRLRAYRPGRRAVVSAQGPREAMYLKVLRPKKIEQLHRDHKLLAEVLPVPHSLGYSVDLGLMALQAMPGHTLRDVLESPHLELPAPVELAELISSLPPPPSSRTATSIIERVPGLAAMIRRILPAQAEAVDRFVDELGEENGDDLGPVHGDFYEAQVLVEGGKVVGFLDVDTYGWGRRGDDPGVMLGHLALWETMSSQPARVREYARSLLDLWDRMYDPYDIRRRAAATLFTLASGPFRVQTADWPGETAARLALAQRWLDTANPPR